PTGTMLKPSGRRAAGSAARLFWTGRPDRQGQAGLLRDRTGEGPMFTTMRADLTATLAEIRAAGLYKAERVIASPQGALLRVGDRQQLINLCSNNYLGLADHPAIVAAAQEGLERWGFGMASVRFICGTQEIHRELEQALTRFLGTEDTIL